MPYDLLNVPLMLPGFLLVLFRVAGLAIASPLYSSTALPRAAKVGMAFAIAVMCYPLAQPTLPGELTLPVVLAGVLGEIMIGLGIGLALTLPFVATQVGGLMIAQQGGLALGRVFNPGLNTQTTPLGQLIYMGMMGIFLMMDGHVAVVRSVVESFALVPPLTFEVTPSIVKLMCGLITSAFVVAVRLAGPALTALFLVTLAMGFISRTVPQLNILAVGFSVRSSTALLMAAVTVNNAQDLLVDAMIDTMQAVQAMLSGQV